MHTCLLQKEDIEKLLKVELDFSVEQLLELEEAKQYAVILHNDPINGVDFVVRVIRAVFKYSTSKSIWLMLKAHFSGKSTLWIGAKHKAKEKQLAMIKHGPDPQMVSKGAKPLTVTIEPA
ncbi:MAG: ATP-dependent Clp protease adaptor ClpS [Candidatus Competibacteraceae bacterium]|jgi:ATP-dependent Clp protease adapter protein ClpS|nr:ATP-dependent Clp protease adaptor ClpS [Candidatus Competibacteraceae bacterium]